MTACVPASTGGDVTELEESAQHYRSRRAAEVRVYSRTVRWMKIALPIGALALIGMVFLTGKERGGVLDVDTSTTDIAALAAGLRLENPHFTGVTDDGAPFVVTADWALPDGAVPDLVTLEAPEGEIRLRDGLVVTVTSSTGEMFRKSEQLHLKGDVVLVTSDGYRLTTEQVQLDLDQKSAIAPSRVEASGPRGAISANRVRMEGAGSGTDDVTVWFEGNVKVTFQPETE